MRDLTVIFLTCNDLPQRWVRFHMEHLQRAVDGFPVITVSREPMSFGRNLIQEGEKSGWNVYRQIWRACACATTDYIAVAEDDTLYSRKHFTDFRPPMDAVSYDMSRWSVFAWENKPVFSCIRRHGNFMMIGPTKLVEEALAERIKKYPNGHDYPGEIGRPDVERRMKVSRHKLVEWWCTAPSVNLGHQFGLSPTYIGRRGLKRRPGEMKAYEIPYWGKAEEVTGVFNRGLEECQSCTTS